MMSWPLARLRFFIIIVFIPWCYRLGGYEDPRWCSSVFFFFQFYLVTSFRWFLHTSPPPSLLCTFSEPVEGVGQRGAGTIVPLPYGLIATFLYLYQHLLQISWTFFEFGTSCCPFFYTKPAWLLIEVPLLTFSLLLWNLWTSILP